MKLYNVILSAFFLLAFNPSAFATGACEQSLSSPATSLVSIFDSAMKWKVLKREAVFEWARHREWSNPFTLASTSLHTPKFVQAFAKIDMGISPQDQMAAKVLLLKRLGELEAASEISDRASRATQAVLKPHVVIAHRMEDFQAFSKGHATMTEQDGRPVLVRYLKNASYMVFDPFNPDASKQWEKRKIEHNPHSMIPVKTRFLSGGHEFEIGAGTAPSVWDITEVGKLLRQIGSPSATNTDDFLEPLVGTIDGQPWAVLRRQTPLMFDKRGLRLINLVDAKELEVPELNFFSYTSKGGAVMSKPSIFRFREEDYVIWVMPRQILFLRLSDMVPATMPAPEIDKPEKTYVFEYQGQLMAFVAGLQQNIVLKLTSD